MLGAALLAPVVLGAWTSDPAATRGGEVRNELRLSVSTNSSTDPAVRLRVGESATRTYHLSNHAEYPLGGVLLNDPQLPGGQLSCGADRNIPPGGALDCTATFTVAPGPQSTQVSAVADAPNHLPQSHADAPAGYLGITAGLRLTRVGAPAGTGLSRRAVSRTASVDGPEASERSTGESPSGSPGRPPELPDARELQGVVTETVRTARARPATRAVAAVGGTVELQYRLEAFGDVPVTAASVTEGLPGLGTVNCAGPDGGHTLTPGQAVDCRATGTARPGRQTGTARADGLADDATIGPDGSRQAPRRVSAEADGAYDGLQPVPSGPEPGGPATTGTGPGPGAGSAASPAPGTGTGTGPGTGTAPGTGAGPGTGTGTAAGAGTGVGTGPGGVASPGAGPGAAGAGTPSGTSGDSVPPGLFPVSVPPGAQPAAAAGQQPGSAEQVQPVAGAPATAGQMLGPFLPGQAPALLPGGTAFARSASPFAAPGPAGAVTPLAGSPVGAAAVNPGTPVSASAPASAPASASGTSSGPSGASGQETGSAVGSQQVGPTAGGSAGRRGESQYAVEDWPPGEEDDSWDGTEVMMLLLAILLPVLCVLAAAFTTRNRGRR